MTARSCACIVVFSRIKVRVPLFHSIGFFTLAAACKYSVKAVSALPSLTKFVYILCLYRLIAKFPAVETGVGNQAGSIPPSSIRAVSSVRQ